MLISDELLVNKYSTTKVKVEPRAIGVLGRGLLNYKTASTSLPRYERIFWRPLPARSRASLPRSRPRNPTLTMAHTVEGVRHDQHERHERSLLTRDRRTYRAGVPAIQTFPPSRTPRLSRPDHPLSPDRSQYPSLTPYLPTRPYGAPPPGPLSL